MSRLGHTPGRRILASIAAGTLAVATAAVGLVVAAPAASASTTAITSTTPLWCWVVIDGASAPVGQISTAPAKWPNGVAGHTSVTHTLTPASASVTAGSSLGVTYGISEGPRNGPSGVTGEVMITTYAVTPSGGSATLVTGSPSAPFNVAGNAWGPATTVSDTLPASAFPSNGTYSIKIHSVDFYAAGNFDAALGVTGSTGITTRCNANDANVDGPGAGNAEYNPYPTDDNAYTHPLTTTISESVTVSGGAEPPPVEIPAVPTGLDATPGNGQVALTWNASTGATSYEVLRDGDVVGTPSGTSYTDTGLTNGTSYNYKVKAKNSAGTSDASAVVSATPVLALPAAPTGLTATPGDGKVTLAWTAVSGATSYQVFRGGDQIGTASTPGYVDSTATNGTSYSYTVKAVNVAGAGDSSAAASATPAAAPASSVAATLACNTLDNIRDWATTLSASLTGSDLNIAFAPGPKNGPVPLQAGWLEPRGTMTVSGTDVAVAGPAYGALPKNTTIPGATMIGTVTGTPTSLTVKTILFKDVGSGSNVDTTCTSASPITVPIVSATELPPTLPTSDGELTLTGDPVAGGSVTLAGTGFGPGTTVTAGMYSTPVTLGVGTADSAGAVSVEVTIPSGTTGSHTMVMLGVDVSGGQWVLTKAVTVAAPSPSPSGSGDPTDDPDPDNDGGLPQTGPEDLGMMLLWGAVALQVGLIVAVRASRSRRTTPTGRHRS